MKENVKFEDVLSALEEEVKRLESGNMSIEDSLVSYEKAIGLVKVCNEYLSDAEGRVRILTQRADGSVSDAPFDGIGDET